MSRFRGFKRLLDWRQQNVGTRDARILESTLTVEGLPYEAIPPAFADDVRRWRKQRTVDRLCVCSNYLWWLRNVQPSAKRSRA